MKNLTKAIVGTAAAAAMAVSATPATANDRKKDKISAGEVIAGVAILGGIAAILSSGKKRDRGYNNGYRGGRYGGDYRRGHGDYRRDYRRDNSRRAINKCIQRVEYKAGHHSYAKVTKIRDVDRTRYGYRIKGRVIVQDNNRRGYGRYNSRYDRGHGNSYNRSYDKGKFTCYVGGRHQLSRIARILIEAAYRITKGSAWRQAEPFTAFSMKASAFHQQGV